MTENPTQTGDQNRHGTDATTLPANVNAKLRWGSYMLAATALLFVLQGVGMIYRALVADRYELGVDGLDGFTAVELAETYPAIQSYIDHRVKHSLFDEAAI